MIKVRSALAQTILSVIAAGILFFILLPTLLSISIIQQSLFYGLKTFTGYEVQCESADIGWLAGIDIKHLQVKDRSSHLYLSLSSLHISTPLYSLIKSPADIGNIYIDDLRLAITSDKNDGLPIHFLDDIQFFSETKSNNRRIIQNHSEYYSKEQGNDIDKRRKAVEKPLLEIPHIATKIDLGNSRIYVRHPSGHYAAIEDINSYLCIEKYPSSIALNLTGNIVSVDNNTSERSVSPLNIRILLSGEELFADLCGKVSAEIKQIPTFFLEGLSSLFCSDISGFIQPFLGQYVSLTLNTDIHSTIINIDSNITSDNVKSNSSITITKDQIKIAKGKLLDMTVCNNFFQAIIEKKIKSFNQQQVLLQKPVKCSLSIDEEAIYSLTEDYFIHPLQIRVTHSPSFIIERRFKGKSLQSLNLDCIAYLLGDTKSEKLEWSVTTRYQKETEKSSISCTVETIKSDEEQNASKSSFQGRDFKGSIICKGPILHLFPEELALPVSTLIGEESAHNVAFNGTIHKSGAISYNGNIQSTFEKGKNILQFSGSNTHISFEKGVGDLLIPYNSIYQALGTTKEDQILDSDLGLRIHTNLSNLSLPLPIDTTTLCDIYCDCTTELQLDTISIPALQLHIDHSSKISCAIAKNRNTNYVSCEVQSDIPLIKVPEFFSAQVPSGTPFIANLTFDTILDRTIQTTIHSLTASLAQALRIEASEVTLDVNLHKQTTELFLSRPCFLQFSANAANWIQFFPQSTPFTFETVISSTAPLIVSKKGGSQAGIFDVKNSLSLSNGKYSIELPVHVDMAKRVLHGSCTLIAGQDNILEKCEAVRNEKALKSLGSAHFLAEFPYELSLQALRNEATFKIDANIKPFLTSNLHTTFSSHIVKTIEDILGERVKTMRIKALYRGMDSEENEMDFSLQSDKLEILSNIRLSKGLLFADQFPFLNVTCIPSQGLCKFLGIPDNIQLDESFSTNNKIDFKIGRVAIPLRAFHHFQLTPSCFLLLLKESNVEFTLNSEPLRIIASRKGYDNDLSGRKTVVMSPISAKGFIDGKTGSILTDIYTKKVGFKDQINTPDIRASITAQLPLSSRYTTNTELLLSSSIESNLQIDNLDPSFISLCLNHEKNTFEELLGTESSTKLYLQLSKISKSCLKIECTSKNLIFSCEGNILNGVFVPSKPIESQLKLTKKLGKNLLQGSATFLAKAIQTEKPITLIVPKDGVSIPLLPFSYKDAVIPKIRIELDRILVKNSGTLKVILKLLRVKKIEKKDEVDLWCTPLQASLKKGVLTCERFDILAANKVQLALWGDANFNTQQIAMNLLIPNSTLNKLGFQAFSTSGLIVPIVGNISDPKVDTARLTAKLAGIGLRSTTIDPSTQILSGLLEVAAGLGENTGAVPPPTTSPFPWDATQ